MSRVAVIDCGTNTVRLLVADTGHGGRSWVERDAVVTRLGAGLESRGALDDAAIERTVEAIGGYVDRARRADADPVRVVATSAARDADNSERFVAAVLERTGLPVQILTGSEEAAYSFAGAVTGVDPPRPALVLDIGGGSTELVLGRHAPIAATSRQLGSVRLTELALPGDPPDAAAVARARGIIETELDAAAQAVDLAAARSLVAVAGTATTLAALHLGLVRYDAAAIHGTALGVDDVRGLVEELRALPAAAIARRGPVAPGREDVLLAGALVLERTLEHVGLERLIVSESDLLDGICQEIGADRREAHPARRQSGRS